MLIMLGLYSADGSTREEVVSCAVEDDGEFEVPSSAFSRWGNLRPMIVYVGRATISTGTVPFNGAESQVAGIYWVVGQAETR